MSSVADCVIDTKEYQKSQLLKPHLLVAKLTDALRVSATVLDIDENAMPALIAENRIIQEALVAARAYEEYTTHPDGCPECENNPCQCDAPDEDAPEEEPE